MAYCTECGAELDKDGVCQKCAAEKEKSNDENIIAKAVDKFKDVPDETDEYTKKDIKDNLFFAIIAYFGILILLPVICVPDSKFARFHANQALNVIIFTFLYSVIAAVLSVICFYASWAFGALVTGIFVLLAVVPFILWIQGIANAAAGKAKELPFIGKLSLLK